jgi:[ribosomal protein S18]-alanine N-acetyltransferase
MNGGNGYALSATQSEILIAQMSEHDLLEVVEIEELSGLSRWGWTAYYAELQGNNSELMLIARAIGSPDEKKIAGYIVARESAGEVHINNVAVRDRYRQQGIGNTLLSLILEKARQRGANAAFLEVRSGNLAAQALYKKCGFHPIAVRPNYYSEPREDAVVMTLTLC